MQSHLSSCAAIGGRPGGWGEGEDKRESPEVLAATYELTIAAMKSMHLISLSICSVCSLSFRTACAA